MNNYFISLLFAFFFLCGITLHADTDGGQTEYVIIVCKTEVLCSFEIPKKYLSKNGELLMPFYILRSNNGKQTLSINQSTETKVSIPSREGVSSITFQIGDYSTTCRVEN